VSNLPTASVRKEVGVVIHHSSPAVHSTPTAYVSYDAVVDTGPDATVRHFDANGVEFKLPQEQPSPAS
jgi:hypothetical protein